MREQYSQYVFLDNFDLLLDSLTELFSTSLHLTLTMTLLHKNGNGFLFFCVYVGRKSAFMEEIAFFFFFFFRHHHFWCPIAVSTAATKNAVICPVSAEFRLIRQQWCTFASGWFEMQKLVPVDKTASSLCCTSSASPITCSYLMGHSCACRCSWRRNNPHVTYLVCHT